jgi:hypothetical protein
MNDGQHMSDSAPRPRPGVVTTLAIIGIAEGILWVLCGGFGLLGNAASIVAGHSVISPAANEPRAMMIVGAAESLALLFLSIVLICASAAALSLKPWARRMLMPWSVIAILIFIVQFLVQALWIGPHAMQIKQNAQSAQSAAALARPLMYGVGVALLIAQSALPICILMMWRSEAVIAAFDSHDNRISQ